MSLMLVFQISVSIHNMKYDFAVLTLMTPTVVSSRLIFFEILNLHKENNPVIKQNYQK